MVNFGTLVPLFIAKDLPQNRSIIGMLDTSNSKYVLGLFHETEAFTVHAKLLGLTGYGYANFFTPEFDSLEELVDISRLYAEDLATSNLWWEDDSKVDYPQHLRDLADYLYEGLEDDEIDEDFLEELKKIYAEPEEKKGFLTLIKSEDNNGRED